MNSCLDNLNVVFQPIFSRVQVLVIRLSKVLKLWLLVLAFTVGRMIELFDVGISSAQLSLTENQTARTPLLNRFAWFDSWTCSQTLESHYRVPPKTPWREVLLSLAWPCLACSPYVKDYCKDLSSLPSLLFHHCTRSHTKFTPVQPQCLYKVINTKFSLTN